MKPDPAQLEDFAKRYTAAWYSRKASSVAAFFAPNGSISVNGTPSVGRGAITEMAQGFMTAFPDLQLLMDDIVLQDKGAVYHWTFIGTNSGPGGTGQRVRFSGFEVWKIGEDGLIAESEGHFDSADYQRQLERGVEESQNRVFYELQTENYGMNPCERHTCTIPNRSSAPTLCFIR
jgi:predicted ester cyclase